MSEKENCLSFIDSPSTVSQRNSMWCSENWYNPYYAIYATFSREEVMAMSDSEVEHLVRLAEAIGDGLY